VTRVFSRIAKTSLQRTLADSPSRQMNYCRSHALQPADHGKREDYRAPLVLLKQSPGMSRDEGWAFLTLKTLLFPKITMDILQLAIENKIPRALPFSLLPFGNWIIMR